MNTSELVFNFRPTEPEAPAAPPRLADPIAIPPPIQPVPTSRATPGRRAGDDYIPLDTCLSDAPTDARHTVMDKVEYDRPTPSGARSVDTNDNVYKSPVKRTPVMSTAPNVQSTHYQHESVYKYPPKRDGPEYVNTDEQAEDEDVYKVPQAHPQTVYDSPPSGHLLKREPSERDSNSSNGSKHSHLCTDDSGLGSSTDNLTKQMRDLRTSQEVYDYPPSSATKHAPPSFVDSRKLLDSVPPPARLADAQAAAGADGNRAQYVNLNEPSHPAPPPSAAAVDSQYDFPLSTSQRKRNDKAMLQMQPPVPSPHTVVTAHQYVNAGAGVVKVTNLQTAVTPTPPLSSPARGVVQSSYLPMNQQSYLPMNQATSQQDSYLPMQSPTSPKQDMYLPMDQNSAQDSYLPMNQPSTPPRDSYTPMQQSDSYMPMNRTDSAYLPMSNSDRYSTDSTYQVVPPGARPVSGDDYDNRMSEYAGNRPVERDSIYAAYPSNRPVTGGRGLDAYVPSGVSASPAMQRARQLSAVVPSRDSDVYDVAPSNRPVSPPKMPLSPALSAAAQRAPSPSARRQFEPGQSLMRTVL